MSWIQRFINRKRLDRQLADELKFHYDQLAEDLLRQGMTPEQARREAALRFGGQSQVAEECRDARGTVRVESLVRDVKYAIRVLAKSPKSIVMAVAAMALAIGANTVIFSGVHALLIKPLPYPEEEELFMLFGAIPGESGLAFSPREFQVWQTGAQTFSSFGVFTGTSFTLRGRGEPTPVFGVMATPGVFSALGVSASLGRVFDGSNTHAGHDHVVVLSDPLWRKWFGSDPDVIGRSVYLNSESHTVVGVMPPDFIFPSEKYQLWVPANLNSGIFQRFPDAHFLKPIGRLRPGLSTSHLSAEVDVLAKRVAELDRSSKRSVSFVALPEVVRGPVRRPLLALMAAVSMVLFIACANVASILLARATARYREFAVRMALGAARLRLVQQLVIESTLLAVTGGAFGVVLALVGVRLVKSMGPGSLPGVERIQVDTPVLIFAVGLSLLTGIVFGLAPAMLAARRAGTNGLRQGTRSTGNQSANRAQRAMVAVEVAIAVMLVAGASLFVHSFVRLSSINPGFRPDHVLAASIVLDERSYPEENQMLRWTRSAIEQARSIPGVDAAALGSHMPFSGQGWGNGYEVEGRPAEPGKGYVAQIRPVSPDFFRTLGIAIRQGEAFTERDVAGAPGVAIINEKLAQKFWPDESAVGKRLRYDDAWLTVRGVVADIKHVRLDAETDPEIYVPYEQLPPQLMKFVGRALMVVVHGSLDPTSMASALRNALQSADPSLAIRELQPLERLVANSLAASTFRTWLLAAFSGISLILAAIGIYGVMSHLVAQRMQEIAVRLALGAPRRTVLQLVVGRALTEVAIGLGIGLAGAVALVGTIRSLLFGINEYDPVAFTIAPLIIIATAIAASLPPAMLAARADPVLWLRTD